MTFSFNPRPRSRSRSLSVAIFVGAIVASLGFAAPASASASASASGLITVARAQLDGSVQASDQFTVTVAAPVGTTAVKFDLDGVYIGQSDASPFQWIITTTPGAHKLDAHWNGPAADRLSVHFTVAGSAGTASAPTPTAAPAAPSVTPNTSATQSTESTGSSHTFTTAPAPFSSGSSGTPVAPLVVTVSTAAQLKGALAASVPGETISLANGTYAGGFTAAAAGTAAAPITLLGSRSAILTTDSLTSGYGLHVTGDYWVINGISVTDSGKGIVLDHSQHTVISGVAVSDIGDEGVHFRDDSSYSSIVGSSVSDTGQHDAGFGEGIYIGSAVSNWATIMGSATTPDQSDDVLVRDNSISNTTAEGVDVKEGTTDGELVGNVFENAGYSGANSGDSWVDVKGNGYLVSGNSGDGTLTDAFQVHEAVAGWGNDNTFSSNTVQGGVSGYLVNVASGVTGTVVYCESTGAGRGLSNISCTN